MTTTDLVRQLSKVLGWEITPIYISGINWVIENAELVGSVYTFPADPIFALVVHNHNILENFDAGNPKDLEIFLALLDLKPPITTLVTWDILVRHLEKNGVGEITMDNVYLAGLEM